MTSGWRRAVLCPWEDWSIQAVQESAHEGGVEHSHQEILRPPDFAESLPGTISPSSRLNLVLIKNLTVTANPAHNTAYLYASAPAPVHPIPAHRFNAEFLPRIAERVQSIFHGTLNVELVPHASVDQPARLRIWATARAGGGRYACPLDITLSWDSYEVDRLFASGGDQRFAEYLGALAGKLNAWQDARQIDFNSRTQADPTVLLGGLDFEHLLR